MRVVGTERGRFSVSEELLPILPVPCPTNPRRPPLTRPLATIHADQLAETLAFGASP